MQCCDDVQKARCWRDLEAFNIEWLWLLGNTKGMYTSIVECRCQHCKNPSSGDEKKSDKVMMEPIKQNSNERGNEAKNYMQHNLKQSNRKGKTTNQVRLTVLMWRSEGNIRKQEGKKRMSAIMVAAMIIKGKAAHSVHSM